MQALKPILYCLKSTMSHGFHLIDAENPNNSYTHSNSYSKLGVPIDAPTIY